MSEQAKPSDLMKIALAQWEGEREEIIELLASQQELIESQQRAIETQQQRIDALQRCLESLQTN